MKCTFPQKPQIFAEKIHIEHYALVKSLVSTLYRCYTFNKSAFICVFCGPKIALII